MTKEEYLKYIDQEPLPEEVGINSNGSKYIKIESVKSKLDDIGAWSTYNFRHFMFNVGNGNVVCSGSLDLITPYKNIVGAATFNIKEYGLNTHYAATLKSLCIVNAVQDIGRYFGKHLNDDFVEIIVPDISDQIDEEWEIVKANLFLQEFKEDAEAYLLTTSFHLSIEAKQIVNKKPSKQK